MITWSEVEDNRFTFDASGITNPEMWLWDKNGLTSVYYPSRHLAELGETGFSKEQIKDKIKYMVGNAVDAMFYAIHQIAKTKSGDIAPEQQFKLDEIKDQLIELMTEQVWQNLPSADDK